jgi:hypothetical protein
MTQRFSTTSTDDGDHPTTITIDQSFDILGVQTRRLLRVPADTIGHAEGTSDGRGFFNGLG